MMRHLFQAFLRNSDVPGVPAELVVKKRPFAVRNERADWIVPAVWLEVREVVPQLAEQLDARVAALAADLDGLPEDGFLPFAPACQAESGNGFLVVGGLGVFRRAGCLWIPVVNSSRMHGVSMCAYLYRSERFGGCVRGRVADRMDEDEYRRRMSATMAHLPPSVRGWVRMNQFDPYSLPLGVPTPRGDGDAGEAHQDRWRQMYLDGRGELVVMPLDGGADAGTGALLCALGRLRGDDAEDEDAVPLPLPDGDRVEMFRKPVRVVTGDGPVEAVVIGRYRHRSCTGARCTLFAVLLATPRGPQVVTVAPPGTIGFLAALRSRYAEYLRTLLRAVCEQCDDTIAAPLDADMINPRRVDLGDGRRRRHGKRRVDSPSRGVTHRRRARSPDRNSTNSAETSPARCSRATAGAAAVPPPSAGLRSALEPDLRRGQAPLPRCGTGDAW